MHRLSSRRRTRLPFRLHTLAVALAAASASTLTPQLAQAQTPIIKGAHDYDLPSDSLATTLNRIAVDAGIALSVDPALVQGKRSNPVRGKFAADAALREALRGSGLELSRTSTGTFTLRPVPPDAVTLRTMKITADADRFTEPAEHGFKADYQRSATKMRLSVRETPQAISVVTADAIKARQARDITSALELTAGLVPSSSSTIGGPFAGRGLETNEQFMLRGQELNGQRDIRLDGFALSAPQLDLGLMERIEVVKGPSSTLYGQGSLGGFINFVRKKPQVEHSTSVAAQVGSWDTYRLELDSTGALTDNNAVSGRVFAAYDDAGSFIDGVWTKRSVLAPNLDAQLGEKTRLMVDLIFQDDDFVPSHGIPLRIANGDELEIPDIPRSRFVGAPADEDSYLHTRLIMTRLDHELTDDWLVTLSLQKGWQKFGRYFDNYAHGGLDSQYDPNPATLGDTSLYADTNTSDSTFWAGEIRLDGHFEAFGREHQLLVGAERNRRAYDDTFGYQQVGYGNIYSGEFPTDGTKATDLYAAPYSGFAANSGAYVQTLLSATERAKVLVGARYDHIEQTGDTDELSQYDTTYRLGATYDISDNLTAYAMYGESFNPVEARTWDQKMLDPEQGRGYELGLKTEWNERRLSATVALYQQDLDNRPIPDPEHSIGSISSGLQRTQGAEIEFFGSPLSGLEIIAGLGWADSEYKDKDDLEYGLVPYGSIKRNGGLYVSYELQEGVLRGFGAGVTYTYVGRRSFAYAGLAQGCCVSGATSDQLWFDGFDRTDLNIFYKGLKDWDFSLQIRNVFDDVYVERMRDIESNNYFGSPTAYLLRVEYTL